ncbi:uncharacterized protein LOC135135580 [Zophobas morio]|uniref:uncharacterized protein LOC135135580 n=1 Tax=Zophobas morio TaxID=2755281 RepID=UPI003082B2E3
MVCLVRDALNAIGVRASDISNAIVVLDHQLRGEVHNRDLLKRNVQQKFKNNQYLLWEVCGLVRIRPPGRGILRAKDLRPMPETIRLKTVTGESTPIMGESEVKICIDNKTAEDKTSGSRGYGECLCLGNEEFILNQRSIESKPVRLIVCQNVKVRGSTETIVTVRAEIKPGFALGIIQPPHTPKKNLMIASALVNTDCDILVRLANVFPKAMNIKSGDVLAICELVTKIFHHHEDLSDNNELKIKSDLEIPALELDHLTEHQQKVAREFQQKHSGMFASGQSSGHTNIVRHRINIGDAQPICQAPRRLHLAKQEETEQLIRKMLDESVIEQSNSPWSSPVVLITKRDGLTRFCVDYRKLNDVTKKDSYPLSLTTLSGSTCRERLVSIYRNAFWPV